MFHLVSFFLCGITLFLVAILTVTRLHFVFVFSRWHLLSALLLNATMSYFSSLGGHWRIIVVRRPESSHRPGQSPRQG